MKHLPNKGIKLCWKVQKNKRDDGFSQMCSHDGGREGRADFAGATLLLVVLESIEEVVQTRPDKVGYWKKLVDIKKPICVACRHIANESGCCFEADVYQCEFISSHLAGSFPGGLFQAFMSFSKDLTLDTSWSSSRRKKEKEKKLKQILDLQWAAAPCDAADRSDPLHSPHWDSVKNL